MKNSFFNTHITGFISGCLLLLIGYFLFGAITSIIDETSRPYWLQKDRLRILTILINIFLFRWLIKKQETENFAKGLLGATFICVITYLILLKRNLL